VAHVAKAGGLKLIEARDADGKPLISEREGDELLAEADDLYEDAKNHMMKRRTVYRLTAGFYRGLQWGESSIDGYDPDLDPSGERREVNNYVRPIVNAAVADILSTAMNPEIVPVRGDPESMARALAATQLARSFLRNGTIPFLQLVRAFTGAYIHGISWLKTYWDPNLGRPIGIGQREGGVAVRAVSILNAFPDPNARDEDEIRYVCHHKMMAISDLEEIFPFDYFGEPTKGCFERAPLANTRGPHEWGEDSYFFGDGHSEGTSKHNELGLLVEIWRKPSPSRPFGSLLIRSGKVLIEYGPLPYEWPWVACYGPNIVEDKFIPDGGVLDLISPQRGLNLSVTKMHEWEDRVINPPMLEPRGAEVQWSEWSDIPGATRLQHNPGFAPRWMDTPQIPVSSFSLVEQNRGVMKDISISPDIARGEGMGASSGREVAYLTEREKSAKAPMLQIARDSVVAVMSKALKLARDRYEEGRLLYRMGEDDLWMVEAFKSEDYDFDAALIVEPFSGAPTSRALRFQETTEAFAAGLLEDTPAAKRARRMLGMDYAGRSTTDPDEQHRMRALQENVSFLRDPLAPLEVHPADDDEIHLECHNLTRISARVMAMPPEVRQILEDHCAMHEEQRAMKLGVFAMEQTQLNGGGASGSLAPGGNPAKRPGAESPMDGGHSAGEGTVEGEMMQDAAQLQAEGPDVYSPK